MTDRFEFLRLAAKKILKLAEDLPAHVQHVDNSNFGQSKALAAFNHFAYVEPSGTGVLAALRQLFGSWDSIAASDVQRGELGIKIVARVMERVTLSSEEQVMGDEELERLSDELEAWCTPLRLVLRKVIESEPPVAKSPTETPAPEEQSVAPAAPFQRGVNPSLGVKDEPLEVDIDLSLEADESDDEADKVAHDYPTLLREALPEGPLRLRDVQVLAAIFQVYENAPRDNNSSLPSTMGLTNLWNKVREIVEGYNKESYRRHMEKLLLAFPTCFAIRGKWQNTGINLWGVRKGWEDFREAVGTLVEEERLHQAPVAKRASVASRTRLSTSASTSSPTGRKRPADRSPLANKSDNGSKRTKTKHTVNKTPDRTPSPSSSTMTASKANLDTIRNLVKSLGKPSIRNINSMVKKDTKIELVL